jgi:D-alanyl-D-alanine carboxypeptidase/D-alanyl-D-alanine-endopeptidase (penicillin-binding protein 4)
MPNKQHHGLVWAAAVAVGLLSLSPRSTAEAPTAAPTASATPPDRAAAEAALERLVAAVDALGGKVGVAVVDLETGAMLVDHRASEPMSPASNMKLVTAWAALRTLGPGHRWLTAALGEIDGDRVPRLTLRGDGDPSLEMGDLWDLCAPLARAGVRHVGEVVVDQSYFDEQWVPPAFAAQPGEWASFRAPVAAVSIAGNAVLVEVRAGKAGEAARVRAMPAGFVDLVGSVQTSAADDAEAVRVDLGPEDGRLSARLGGSIPEGRVLPVYKRVDDPRLFAGYGLVEVLAGLGITVEGGVSAGAGGGEALATHRSARLTQLLPVLGKDSNNFYAEMTFKSLSGQKGGPPASHERSARLVEGLLAEIGIDRADFSIHNGSGLFDGGRIAARALARLLVEAWRDPRTGPDFVAHLAIGGADGTLQHRLERFRATRSIRAKTGTLARVTALSGYVLGSSGPRYAFVVLAGDAAGAALRDPVDAFVAELAANLR